MILVPILVEVEVLIHKIVLILKCFDGWLCRITCEFLFYVVVRETLINDRRKEMVNSLIGTGEEETK